MKIYLCNAKNKQFSININEAIRAFLNSYFFLQKDFARNKSTKNTKKHQKHQNAQKAPKSTKKNKNATKKKQKTQISEQKFEMCLKTYEWKKVTYSLISVLVFFCARKEKK